MISLTVPTATMKGRAETKTNVKLDLVMRFKQEQRRTTETGNNKKLKVMRQQGLSTVK